MVPPVLLGHYQSTRGSDGKGSCQYYDNSVAQPSTQILCGVHYVWLRGMLSRRLPSLAYFSRSWAYEAATQAPSHPHLSDSALLGHRCSLRDEGDDQMADACSSRVRLAVPRKYQSSLR